MAARGKTTGTMEFSDALGDDVAQLRQGKADRHELSIRVRLPAAETAKQG